MRLTLEQALLRGVTAHKEGRLQDATGYYRAILQARPTHPDANHNLGVLFVSSGKVLDALPLFEQALASNPNIEQFWLSKIDALIKAEKFDEANEALCECQSFGVTGAALDVLQKKIVALEAKCYGDSKKLKQRPPRIAPDISQLEAAIKYLRDGKIKEAIDHAAVLTEEFPSHPLGWKILGLALGHAGRPSESLVALRKAVHLAPSDTGALNNLGVALKAVGRIEEAVSCYRRAVKVQPNSALINCNLGVSLRALGRLKEAESFFAAAIRLKSDYAEAHRYITTTKNFTYYDEQFLQMQHLYVDENTSETDRCQICFALAKAHEDLGEFAEAYKYYAEGNALRRTQLSYDKEKVSELFQRITEFNSEISKHALDGDDQHSNLVPIFIVGMPRSGTTLIEQIISSHSNVTGAGELPFVSQFGSQLAAGLQKANKTSLEKFRADYFAAIQSRAYGKPYVTDKMPLNFQYLGLISSAIPEARMIHVGRNAAAVCWANYTQYFKDGLRFSNDLRDILDYYGYYQGIMKFWSRSIGERIYDINYEALTVNQEKETRKLIDYLELDWEVSCLSPESNKRSVATASSTQIRRKVYQGSSEKWQKYRPYLDGILDHLR